MRLVEGFHVRRMADGKYKINDNKKYVWKIPTRLDGEIDKGDIVWVHSKIGEKDFKLRVWVVDIIESEEGALRSVIQIFKKFDKINFSK